MNVSSIVATAASGTVVLTFVGYIVRKVVKFCQDIAAAAKTAADRSAELKPNGGSSMRDAVNRIEEHLRKQDIAIAELQGERRGRRWLRG